MGDQDAQPQPGTAPENGDYLQQPQMAGQDAPRSPQPYPGQQPGQQPQRYHGTRPQRQQQHYKLQAKVTGLERNSKKDPILRFDVYVRLLPTFNAYELDLRGVVDIDAWIKASMNLRPRHYTVRMQKSRRPVQPSAALPSPARECPQNTALVTMYSC
jgi:hypothetical protein